MSFKQQHVKVLGVPIVARFWNPFFAELRHIKDFSMLWDSAVGTNIFQRLGRREFCLGKV